MAEKFVRKIMTDKEKKETFKKIEASRPKSPCKAEKDAIEMFKKLAKKFEKLS